MDFTKTEKEPSPDELKHLVAQGNEPAFRKLFNLLFAHLIQFAFSLVKSKNAATDIVDEVFIRLWKNRAAILSINNLRAYLYRAVRNSSLNYLSQKTRLDVFDPFDDFSIQLRQERSPEQLMVTKEIVEKIHEAVNSLPPRCKMVFMLVREDGLKYKEVAEILSLSVKTVDAQMVIAINRIREILLKGQIIQPSQKKSQKK